MKSEGVVDKPYAEIGIIDHHGKREEQAGIGGGKEGIEQGEHANAQRCVERAVNPLQALPVVVGEVLFHALFIVMIAPAEDDDVIDKLAQIEQRDEKEGYLVGESGFEMDGSIGDADCNDRKRDGQQLAHKASPGEELHIDECGERECEKEGLSDANDNRMHLLQHWRYVYLHTNSSCHEGNEVQEICPPHHAASHSVTMQPLVVGYHDKAEAQTETENQSWQCKSCQYIVQNGKHEALDLKNRTKIIFLNDINQERGNLLSLLPFILPRLLLFGIGVC